MNDRIELPIFYILPDHGSTVYYTGRSINKLTIVFVNCSGCSCRTVSAHASLETLLSGKTTEGYRQHVTFKFLLQHVLDVTAPVRHHLGQPNLLQVRDGPVDHVHRQTLHLHPIGQR